MNAADLTATLTKLSEQKLTAIATLTLLHISKGSQNMTSLANACRHSTAAATEVVDRLVLRQLATRRVPANDRRMIVLEVTPKGLAALGAIMNATTTQTTLV